MQLVIHQELQTLFRPVFDNRSCACMYGKGPIRAAFNVQHDMRVARMKWGDEATVIKIDVRKFFYSIDRSVLKQIIAKRFKKLKKKYPEKYEDFLRFYRLLCKVIDSSPEGERGIPLGNVSSQDFANIYLNELDQFCIRFLGATLYTRYISSATDAKDGFAMRCICSSTAESNASKRRAAPSAGSIALTNTNSLAVGSRRKLH